MTLTEAIKLLENFNIWRRGVEIPQPNPTDIGIAISMVLKEVKSNKENWTYTDQRIYKTPEIKFKSLEESKTKVIAQN